MKVIDLLVDKANGKDLPKKIKIMQYVFEYNYQWGRYMTKDKEILGEVLPLDYYLNDEIEIIEESKKIEKLPYCEENTFKNIKECSYLSVEEKRLLDSNFKTINDKFNEIIDYINSKEDK